MVEMTAQSYHPRRHVSYSNFRKPFPSLNANRVQLELRSNRSENSKGKVNEEFEMLRAMIRASASPEQVQSVVGEGKNAVEFSHGSARLLALKRFKKLSKDAESKIDKLRTEQTDNQVGIITPKGGIGIGRKVTKTPISSPFGKSKLPSMV